MREKGIALVVIALMTLSSIGFAERVLDSSEILQIFNTLTSQPREGWISSGTIEAIHESHHEARITDPAELALLVAQAQQEYLNNPNKRELSPEMQQMRYDAIAFNVAYKQANTYQMTTRESVQCDGSRFKWKIDVLSREDSVKVPANSNFMHDHFDLESNARRVFAWDGERYTTYCRSANYAVVDEGSSNTSVRVHGPLTAGCIPWGNGIYDYSQLAAAQLSGVEIVNGTQTEIHVNLVYTSALEVSFVFDPDKDNALLNCTISKPGNLTIVQSYDDYLLVSGQWQPFTIVIEYFQGDMGPLISRDTWNFTDFDNAPAASQDFEIAYEQDALVEYRAVASLQSQKYRYSDPVPAGSVDVESLLTERLAVASGALAYPVNCATLALKYVAGQLGQQTDDQQLSQLIDSSTNQTSLYAINQHAQGLGLYAMAVQTDLETLKSLQNCQVILHLTGNNHFVALGSIDGEYIRLIDLSRENFYYRTSLISFQQDWRHGTALILSNEPIVVNGNLDAVEDVAQQSILGAHHCGLGCYDCTYLLQEASIIPCDPDQCTSSTYIHYFERWGCQTASSGSCNTLTWLKKRESPCIIDPYNPELCIYSGNWSYYFMQACG